MPMHPRLKMRRGRFGAGGFSGPVLKITFPAGNAIISGSPAVPFTATAFDDIDGDISANITWFVAGPGSPSTGVPTGSPVDATGASVNLSAFTTAGSPIAAQTVHATITDSGGKTSTLSITVRR